jgi:co-chaperonin GroES (HSP10)
MIQATGTRLIITKQEQDLTTSTGIVLKHTDEYPRARVASVGPRIDIDVVVGQEILVDWSRVGRFEHDKQEYFVVDQSNVMGAFD